MTNPERHPIAPLLEAIAAALRAQDAPTRFYSNQVVLLQDEEIVSSETPTPYYAVSVGPSQPLEETADSISQSWTVTVWAVQDLRGPEIASPLMGLAPHSPPARAGVLDLAWAAFRVLRGRSFGDGAAKWVYSAFLGETTTQSDAEMADGKVISMTVRRGLKFRYTKTGVFEPQT